MSICDICKGKGSTSLDNQRLCTDSLIHSYLVKNVSKFNITLNIEEKKKNQKPKQYGSKAPILIQSKSKHWNFGGVIQIVLSFHVLVHIIKSKSYSTNDLRKILSISALKLIGFIKQEVNRFEIV